MRGLVTIAIKDFKQLVAYPLFWMIVTACTAIWSYSYLRSVIVFARMSERAALLQGARPGMNIHYVVFLNYISLVNIIFLFIIPAITMRLIAEEKKLRTYDLLLTSPVTATDIAVGKFLAGFGAALVLILISFLYPLGTAFFADFSFGPLLSSYMGLILVTGCYVAAGLFASSLTQSVLLSVVLGVIFNLILWFIGQGVDFSDKPFFREIMEHLSFGEQFYNFLKGDIKISSLVFFLSVISLFVFLSQRAVEASRWR
ncbi:MAG: ABC transporter permease [Bdellovibrio sp.]|nr:MAG: ABC transporter permease [Bdellovibrio sp.]